MPAFDPTSATPTLALPPPRLDRGATLYQALDLRRSAREFGEMAIPIGVLSTLLWCACGINRPDTGDRTVPSARNWQEIGVYAALAAGLYRYEPGEHVLRLVVAQDLRALTGVQDFVATAPLDLVYVADFARMVDASDEDRAFLAAADAAFIAQNVYLYCANAGLATVVRALVDRAKLARAMGLGPHERIVLAQTVGFPARGA